MIDLNNKLTLVNIKPKQLIVREQKPNSLADNYLRIDTLHYHLNYPKHYRAFT